MDIESLPETASWNWDRVTDPNWMKPAEDVFSLLHRWREAGYSSLLDLGCGLGRHSLLFAQHGFRVTALDSSPSGLQRLTENARKMNLVINPVLAGAADLPLVRGSFDAVLAYHSLYHVDSRGMSSAVGELHRIVKPGGEVYLTLISKNAFSYTDPESKVIDNNVRIKQEEDGSLLPHYFCDRKDINRLFSGFNLLRLRQIEDIYDKKSSWHYFLHATPKDEA
jgi:SAM-dependent methyltransferase